MTVGLTGLVAMLLLAPACAAGTTIGSSLSAPPSPSEGVCAFLGSAGLAKTCTDAQLELVSGQLASGGLTAPASGTILSWSVRSGPASPSTGKVKLRLRTLDAKGEAGASTPPSELPLAQPGIHTFPAQLPVEKGDRLAVEAVVTASGDGPAYVPIVRVEPGLGTLAEWHSPLFPGIPLAPDTTLTDRELLLSADLSFDRTPPQTKLTYPVQQDFLAEKTVLIHVRCNEAATVTASGQLEIPSRHTIFGLYGATAKVGAGKRATLHLRLAKNTLKAARRANANGRKIVVKVVVSATDAAGNRSGVTVATIKPR